MISVFRSAVKRQKWYMSVTLGDVACRELSGSTQPQVPRRHRLYRCHGNIKRMFVLPLLYTYKTIVNIYLVQFYSAFLISQIALSFKVRPMSSSGHVHELYKCHVNIPRILFLPLPYTYINKYIECCSNLRCIV